MEEILRDLDEIISIESVGDINAPVKPFGEGSRKALDWGKAYLEKLGKLFLIHIYSCLSSVQIIISEGLFSLNLPSPAVTASFANPCSALSS